MTADNTAHPSAGTTKTGIAGFDYLLRGGLPADRIHLVEGHPGSGKTTFGLQFLLAGLKRGESCMYITLSETADELRANACFPRLGPVGHSHSRGPARREPAA